MSDRGVTLQRTAIITQRVAAGMIGVGPQVLRSWYRSGKGPRPVEEREGVLQYLAGDVLDYIAQWEAEQAARDLDRQERRVRKQSRAILVRQRLAESQRDLVGRLNDEVRNPLQIVVGALDLVDSDQADVRQKMKGLIRNAVDRIARAIPRSVEPGPPLKTDRPISLDDMPGSEQDGRESKNRQP